MLASVPLASAPLSHLCLLITNFKFRITSSVAIYLGLEVIAKTPMCQNANTLNTPKTNPQRLTPKD